MNDLFAPQPWTMLEWDTSITIRCGKEMVCRCTNNARGKQYAKAIKALPEMYACLKQIKMILEGFGLDALKVDGVRMDEIIERALRKVRGEE